MALTDGMASAARIALHNVVATLEQARVFEEPGSNCSGPPEPTLCICPGMSGGDREVMLCSGKGIEA